MINSNLVHNIRKYIELNDNEIPLLEKYTQCVDLKKNDFLLREGQVCRSLYFVEKGCLRMYFLNNKSSEQITQFALENWWMSDYFSFMDKRPSGYCIQAIEKSEVFVFESLSFNELLLQLPKLERYFRIIIQNAVAAFQHRGKLQYQISKEQFYWHFVTSFPEFNQRVPQYMIASYLGLTPEYVSELRKKKQVL